MSTRSSVRLFVMCVAFALVPRAALSACCELFKIDADPPSVQVRACEPDASGGCTSWLFEGSLAEGEHAPICASGGTVSYQELEEATQSYAAFVEARCDEGGRVEL